MPTILYDAILKALQEVERKRVLPTPPPYASLFSRTSAPSATGYSSLFRTLSGPAPSAPSGLSESILKALAAKAKVFVSYHHGGDRKYYDQFSRVFRESYDVCHDNSVDRVIDNDDSEYVIRTIREQYLTGTSCTIVLCGAYTRWRKFVDWEIKATLDKQHGLIGINLPTNPRDSRGYVHVPDRLQDNIASGFALWYDWSDLVAGGTSMLRSALQAARLKPRASIANSRALRQRNG